jgi:hypothetical protein
VYEYGVLKCIVVVAVVAVAVAAVVSSPPSSIEVKNVRAILPLPHTSSWRGA